MQQKHEEEIATLRAEQTHPEQSSQYSVSNHENGNEASRNQQPSHPTNPNNHNQQSSHHTNPNDQGRREANNRVIPTPLQIVRPTNLLSFTAAIIQASMPEKTPPILEKYDGSTDPDDHLRTFMNAMFFTFYGSVKPIIIFYRSTRFLTALKRSVLTARSRLCFPTLNIFFYSVIWTQFRSACVRHRSVFNYYAPFSLLAVFSLQLCSTPFGPQLIVHPVCSRSVCICIRSLTDSGRSISVMLLLNCQERVAKFIYIEDMRSSRKKQQQEASAGGNRRDDIQSFGDNDKGGDPRPKDFP
ncbi:hypothetical protein LR48_Vigan02g065100 [Vigna angularis]|uniref:Uncharacterized protein n=1 Tax=Phaseolus angularis TaxID=3914 RepID=A0A0L9TVK5_PHAAN|nr:hypothetical protein LR48_Vigan02g065100 [Vigna angularis]